MPTTTELPVPVATGAITPVKSPGSDLDEPALDWVGFCARSFPGRRPRHGFQAAEAYGVYRRGVSTGVSDLLAFEGDASRGSGNAPTRGR